MLNDVTIGNVSVWSEELIKITSEGEKALEIGCGTGTSSLWLAKHNKGVTALDYTKSSVALVENAKHKLGRYRMQYNMGRHNQGTTF